MIKIIIKFILYFLAGWFMYTDSKNRDTSGILWCIAALILWIFGFFHLTAWIVYPVFIVLYFIFRNKGELVYCTECFKKKLIDKPYCPHCFHIDETVIEEELEEKSVNEEDVDSSVEIEENTSEPEEENVEPDKKKPEEEDSKPDKKKNKEEDDG